MTRTKGGVVRKFTWTYAGQRHEAWGFSVNVNGRKTRRQGFLSKAEALDALEAFKDESRNSKPQSAQARTITLAAAFERYLQAKSRKRSLDEDQRIAKHLKIEFGAETLLADITAARISEYKDKLLAVEKSRRGGKLSAGSIDRPLALLRHLLQLACEEWEMLPAVPKIKLEKEPQGRLRWLTPEDATRLLDVCRAARHPALADLVEFALYTGLRQGEALGLTWDRVDRSRGVVRLEVTKNGRRREVPLNGPADAVLARRKAAGSPDGLVFGTSSWDAFRKGWEAAVEAAQLDDFRFHDLRHTFASWAIQRGATLPELQDLLGHASHAMVRRYSHLAPENLRTAVSRLDDVLKGGRRAEEVEALVPSKS